MESVYSRFHSREEDRGEAELDAQTVASQAIESLTKKDDRIAALEAEVISLKAELDSRPKFVSEQEFKTKVPPPPPPPAKRKPTLAPNPPEIASPKPSPPPPPPPPPPLVLTQSPVSDTQTSPSSPPPPPPPPPPPLVLPISEDESLSL